MVPHTTNDKHDGDNQHFTNTPISLHTAITRAIKNRVLHVGGYHHENDDKKEVFKDQHLRKYK